MSFNQDLEELLKTNEVVTLQQATDLLPSHAKHRVMHYLNDARNGGYCRYAARVQNGKGEVVIMRPQVQGVNS